MSENRQKTILLVEDEPIIAMLEANQLEKARIQLLPDGIPHHIAAGTDCSITVRKDVGKQLKTKWSRVLGE